jgi:hypothetical protein
MKQISIAVVLWMVLSGWAGLAAAEKPMDFAGKPTVYCNVSQEPDPHLLGGWKCIFPLHLENGELDTNPAEYWLVKDGDRYALYFDRRARNGRKRYFGWKDWTVSGSEITSGTGVRIFAQNGEVFFQWKDERPAKMTRINSK